MEAGVPSVDPSPIVGWIKDQAHHNAVMAKNTNPNVMIYWHGIPGVLIHIGGMPVNA
jgi:hypothetical protein